MVDEPCSAPQAVGSNKSEDGEMGRLQYGWNVDFVSKRML